MINSTKKRTDSSSHLNHMNGISYDIKSPILQLRTVASSCFFGEPMYYSPSSKTISDLPETTRFSRKNEKYLNDILTPVITIPDHHKFSPSKLMETAIDEALDFDAEATLQEAVRIRQDENIRTTPQVIMVRAANHKNVRGTNLISKYGLGILSRTDEAAVQLAYQIQVYGKPIPNSLKRIWKKFLETRTKYQLTKYRMENRAFKTLDVVNLVHAKGEFIDCLMRGTLKQETSSTWESLISKEGSTKETWSKAIELMGHMALLRNINNFIKNNVDEKLYLQKLLDTAVTGKQLPFRYFSAYKTVESVASGNILDAIEECMELSIGTLPVFKGKVISLSDNSGSAQGTTTSSMGQMKNSSIGNLMAVLTGKTSDDGYIGVFGDSLEISPVRKKESTLSQLKQADKTGDDIGMRTENGIWMFFDDAINKKEHYDHIFVYSDMQAGHGGLFGLREREYEKYTYKNTRYIDVASLVRAYRKEVNKDVLVYLVQTAGNRDALIPEFYDKTYILGGWSDKILRFAHEMSELNQLNN